MISKFVKDATGASKNSDSTLEKVSIWYRLVVTLLIAFPLLYIAGFITGLLWFMNPHEAGVEAIKGLF
jgi:hypothetical protein